MRLDESRLHRIDAEIDAAIEAAMIPGAVVGVATADRTVYLKAFGWRDRAAGVPMTTDSIFRTASMTKPLVAATTLALVESGRLRLDQPIGACLPALRALKLGIEATGRLRLEPTRNPTVLDLLRQTSGFTNLGAGTSLVDAAYAAAPNLRDHQQTNAELVDKLAKLPLRYVPGTTFEYGMGFDVLGALLEVAGGENLDALVRRLIFEPLGMNDSGFLCRDEARLAEPQVDAVTGLVPDLGYQKGRPPRWFRGGGGVLSTAPDYLRFCRMLLNDGALDGRQVLAPISVRRLMTAALPADVAFAPQTAKLGLMAPSPALGQSFALGGMVRTDVGLHPWPGNVGDYSWSGRAGTYFWVDPAEGFAAVLMMQSAHWRDEAMGLLRASVYAALQ